VENPTCDGPQQREKKKHDEADSQDDEKYPSNRQVNGEKEIKCVAYEALLLASPACPMTHEVTALP
jgi:hypothetical protein